MKHPHYQRLITLTLLTQLAACAYVGPPPEPEQIKADQQDSLAFLKSVPHSGKRDLPYCKYLANGIQNVSGEITSYDQFSVTSKVLDKETIVSLLLPSKRQYLAIPSSSDVLDNECIAFRFIKQKEHAFYWGKDRNQETADKVIQSLLKLGVTRL